MITNIAMFSDRKPIALGYFAALAAVFITAVYPALTRLSVTTTLTPADLLLFRLGGSGLLFAPFLVMRAHEIRRADWLASLPLSFLHGWGMAACVVPWIVGADGDDRRRHVPARVWSRRELPRLYPAAAARPGRRRRSRVRRL